MKFAMLIAVAAAIGVAVAACVVAARARRVVGPKSHREMIRTALVRLLSRPSGAFVVIEDARSGKFVQFAGSSGEPLLLDLPSQTLSPQEMAKAKAVFSNLGYPGPETYRTEEFPGGPPAGEQTTFNVKFGSDVDKATDLALAVLYQVYDLDDAARLRLQEE